MAGHEHRGRDSREGDERPGAELPGTPGHRARPEARDGGGRARRRVSARTISVITLLVEIAGVIVVALYTVYAKRQVEAMRAAVEVAQKQLGATDRPWLKVDVQLAEPVVFSDAGAKFAFQFTLTNVGRSVATRIHPSVAVTLRSGEGADWEQAAAAQAGECELALKLAEGAKDGGSVLFPGEQASFPIASQVARERINAGLVQAGASGRTGAYVQPILVGCAVYLGPNSSDPHATRFAYSLVRKGPREGARGLGFEVGRDVRASDVVLDRMWFGGNSAD